MGKKYGGKNRRGNRSGSTNNPVTVQTVVESIERGRERQNDCAPLRGQLELQVTGTGGVQQLLALNPASMGVRSQNFQVVFTKYRFNEVVISFCPGSSTGTSGICYLGFLDDSPAEGDQPVSGPGVMELRCSAVNFAGQTVPSLCRWKPNDRIWRYNYGGMGTVDARLVNAGTVYVYIPSGIVVNFFVQYSMTFKGATDTGSLVSLPSQPRPLLGGQVRSNRDDEEYDGVVVPRTGLTPRPVSRTPSRV